MRFRITLCVDKERLTQVGRAMKELGVQMIAAYSPQARGRSEFRNLARPSATGTSSGPDQPSRGGEPILAGPLYRRVQYEIHGRGTGERDGFPALQPNRLGLG